MRSLYNADHADAKLVGGVIGILITLIIAVLVFYNIAGSIDTTSIDLNLRATEGAGAHAGEANGSVYAENASGAVLDQASTFFTIAPIIAIVAVAVVILKYVGQI